METLTTFFGWMALINIAYLAISTVAIMGLRPWVTGVHQRVFGVDEKGLKLAYFNWLGNYKIMTLVFAVAPYIALRLM